MQVNDRESNFHRKFHRALSCTRPQPQHLGAPGRMDGVFTLSSVSPDTTLAGAVASRVATGYRPQPGRSLTHQELGLMRAALAAHDRPGRCPATQVCVQVLRVLAEDGARTAEVRLASVQNLDLHEGVLRWARGKNGLPRLVVLSPLSLALLKTRAAAARSGPLFMNPASGRVVTHHAINKVVKRIAADAGLPEPHDFSPHDFRHTFATLAFGAGASLEDVAAALGHTSTAVTKSTYLHNVVSPGARRAHAAAHGRAA